MRRLIANLGVVLGVSLIACLFGWSSPRASAAVEEIAGTELTSVPIHLEENLAVVEVAVAGKTLPLLLDLGGFDSVALRSQALDGLGARFTGRKKRWADSRGRRFRSRQYLLARGHDRRSAPQERPPAQTGATQKNRVR